MNATKFRVTNEGVLQSSKDITPGLYSVKIDINELTESKQSDYLFKVSGELNPSLDLTVTLEKIQSPPFEWFFYDSNSNNLDEGFGLNTINNTASVYETNVSRRGTVMQYSKTNLGEEDTDFFKSYAVPLFVRLVSDSNGNTNGRLKVVEEEISTQFKPENGTFSYWTGFASSIDNGCATITDAQSTLPYRVSDLVIRQNGNIEYNSFDYPMMNATANSKMYLETVLYLPQSKSMSLVSPMKMYTKNTTCANPQDANCLININTNVKMGEAYDLNMAFTGIKEGKICISKKVSATGEVWDLFWNQNEMLKLLADRKANIISTNRDANLCESREILGG
jgi:hypothetical protein